MYETDVDVCATWSSCSSRCILSDFIRCLPLTVNGRKNLKEQLVSNLYSLYRGNDRFKGTTSRNM